MAMASVDHNKGTPVIVLTGGGTGGHITPILAVAGELKKLDTHVETVYVGEKGGKFGELTDSNPSIDRSFSVRAGKLRRYHGESWLTRLLDVKTMLLNLRDMFYVLIGIAQAWLLLGRLKPSVVFLKGGFVGVPIGLAAAMRRIPIVTHDSDALPGLANRLVSRWARVHATALPADTYQYPDSKVVQVGVLVEATYEYITPAKQAVCRQHIDVPKQALVLLITGGSSGAQRLNEAMRSIVSELFERFPELVIIHQVGKGKQGVYDGFSHERLRVMEFLNPMYEYMGSADLVVSRGSGNTIAELGVQAKASIIVPSPYLTGGHQLLNARRLEDQGSAVVVQETEMNDDERGLLYHISDLLKHESKRVHLAETIHKEVITDAAQRLAGVLLEQAKTENT